MLTKNFKFFFENPIGNKNINWIISNLYNTNYIINFDDSELLDKTYISGYNSDSDIWIKVIPENYDSIKLKAFDFLSKNMGIVLDLSHRRSIEDLEEIKRFKTISDNLKIIVEISSIQQILHFTQDNYDIDGLIVKGSDSLGFVSDATSWILSRLALNNLHLPVIVKGGIGFSTILSYYSAGCTGVVFDSQILFLKKVGIPEENEVFIKMHSANDSLLVGTGLDLPYRFSSRTSKKVITELREYEAALISERSPLAEKQEKLRQIINSLSGNFFSQQIEEKILPISQDIFLAEDFKEMVSVENIVWTAIENIRKGVFYLKENIPVRENNGFSLKMNSRFPIIQGPMAHISDSCRFAEKIAGEGALPVIALGGKIISDIEKITGEMENSSTSYPYGFGIIGFDPELNEEKVFPMIKKAHPQFVVIAGASVKQVNYFKEAGISVFVHTPNKESFDYFISEGCQNFIFEGTEAGGHVGSLSLMIIIEMVLKSLRKSVNIDKKQLSMVFAGGINDDLSSLMINAALIELHKMGINTAFQMGTAYMATKEAKNLGIITEEYFDIILSAKNTMVVCDTVNTPIRLIPNTHCRELFEAERGLLLEKRELNKKKDILNTLKRGKLFLAAKGSRIVFGKDESTSYLEKGTKEEIMYDGAFSAGESILFIDCLINISELHEKVINKPLERIMELKERISPDVVVSPGKDNDIAIVGIGAILPDSPNAESFWINILNNFCAIKDVPEDRWNKFLFFSPDREKPDTTYCKLAGFITDYKPDPMPYRIVPKSVSSTDIVQFMFLDAVKQAMEDSGYSFRDFNRDKTAVFVGNGLAGELKDLTTFRVKFANVLEKLDSIPEFARLTPNTRFFIKKSLEQAVKSQLPEIGEDVIPGILSSIIAGKATNIFDLKGGNFSIDAACASTLAALDVGMMYLKSGQLDMVIVGGADRLLNEHTFITFCKANTLGDRGSFPFDDRANGFIQGEGAGAFVLKRLSDAVKDGDKIYALIKGSNFSSDGKGKGITAPNINGQIQSIKGCYDKMNISPLTIGLLEAHGTATPVGDPNEINALDSVWKEVTDKKKICAIGSVKSNIGHLKTGAGVPSLIKTALSLYYKIIPATINFKTPNSSINFEESCFYVNTQSRIWNETDHPRRAGINGFGFGGVNYHVLLEEFTSNALIPKNMKNVIDNAKQLFSSEVLLIGGSSMMELIENLTLINETVLFVNYEEFAEFTYNCNLTFSKSAYLVSMVVSDSYDVLKKIGIILDSLKKDNNISRLVIDAEGIYFYNNITIKKEEIGVIFPGQGSQYLDMTKELINTFPQANEAFRKAKAIYELAESKNLEDLLFSQPWQLNDEKIAKQNNLSYTKISQPAVIVTNLIYYSLLEAAGISPYISVGHSLGEYSALYAGKFIDFDSTVSISINRGKAFACLDGMSNPGKMASISLEAEKVEKELEKVNGYVIVSNYNCYSQTVISGESEAVEAAVKIFSEMGIKSKILPVSNAFHSKKVSHAVSEFEKFLTKSVQFSKPVYKVMSNSTGILYKSDEQFFKNDIYDYLAQHIIQPVRFIDNIENMYNFGIKMFIETGPKNHLSRFVENILKDKEFFTVEMDNHRRSSIFQFQNALAQMSSLRVDIDWENLYKFRNFKNRDVHEWLLKLKENILKSSNTLNNNISFINSYNGFDTGLIDPDISSQAKFAEYIENRSGYIRSMIRLDYDYFTGMEKFLDNEAVADYTGVLSLLSTSKEESAALIGEPTKVVSIRDRIMIIIGDLTGYPKEMLKDEMDLEADLGIDSLKQLDIYKRLSDEFRIKASDFEENHGRTIGEIISFLESKITLEKPIDGVASKETRFSDNEVVANYTGGPSLSGTSEQDSAVLVGESTEAVSIGDRVMIIIGNLTGYPKEMLKEEMDLEADLGIDSLKQLDIYKKLSDEFQIKASDFEENHGRTIGEIISFLESKITFEKPIEVVAHKENAIEDNYLENAVDTVCYRYVYNAIPVDTDVGKAAKWLDESGLYIIIADRMGVFEKLSSVLKEKNIDFIVLFDTVDKDIFNEVQGFIGIDMVNKSSIKNTFENIKNRYNKVPSALISLYSLRETEVRLFDENSNYIEWGERIALGHFFLVQELISINQKSKFITTSLLNGSYGINDLPMVPQTGAVISLLKTLMLEYPDIMVKNIDLCLEDGLNKIFESIINELESGNESFEVGYQGMKRIEIYPVHKNIEGKEVLKLDKDSVVIAFGAGGGVTSLLCGEIASRFKSRIYLVGRAQYDQTKYNTSLSEEEFKQALITNYKRIGNEITPQILKRELSTFKKNISIHNTIKQLASLGSNAKYYCASAEKYDDVTNVAADIFAKEGHIDLVIDGVGILEDKLIKDMNEETLLKVYRNKVNSFINIIRSMEPCNPKMIVSFSSIAGRYGSEGQANYSMGNDLLSYMSRYLNKGKEATGTVYKTLIWGAWLNLGMTENKQLMEYLINKSMSFINTKDGADFFIKEITLSNDTASAFHGKFGNPFFTKSLMNSIRKEEAILGEIVYFEPYKHLILKKHFSLTKELFLKDHIIFDEILVPGCYILELFAGASKMLFPIHNFLEFQDVEFLIPIKIENELEEVEIEAFVQRRTVDEAVIKLTLSTYFVNDRLNIRRKRKHAVGEVFVGIRTEKIIKSEEKYNILLKIDETDFFHGSKIYEENLIKLNGYFRSIDKLNYLDSNECITFIPLKEHDVFSNEVKYNPVADSFLCRDAYFQTVAIWDAVNNQNVSIPARIKKLKYFDKEKEHGYYCHAFNFKQTEKTLSANILVYNSKNEVVEIIEGYETQRYKNLLEVKPEVINKINSLKKK